MQGDFALEGYSGAVLPSGRLKRGGATLAVVAVLLAATVFIGRKQPAAYTSAVPEKGIVYALSYDSLDTRKGLALLRSDIEYMERLGLRSILPGEGDNGVILIAQGKYDIEKLAQLLKKQGARAVLVMESTLTAEEIQTAFRYADEGLFALAAPVDLGCAPTELFKKIGATAADFALRFGRRCRVFVSTVPNEAAADCIGCSAESRAAITLFIFGNGRNEGPFPQSGLTVLNRCMRLPEWTIAQFFSEIAVGN